MNRDDTDVVQRTEPEGRAEPAYGRDPAYAPLDDYEATGVSGVGGPEVWGANSFGGGTRYPGRGREDAAPQPPLFPTDDDYFDPRPAPRRRPGALVAALGALVLLGVGVVAGVTLGGSPARPAATSNPPTNHSAGSGAPARATTTTPSTSSAAGAQTTPTTEGPTTPPTTAVVALPTWTARELNLILQIKRDLTAVNGDLSTHPDFSRLRVNAVDLQQDLSLAQRSPVPANTVVAQEWTQLLHDMGTSNNDLNRAISTRDPNVAQDLAAPLTNTDTDYNALSHTLDAQVRHADGSSGGNGSSRGNSQGQNSD